MLGVMMLAAPLAFKQGLVVLGALYVVNGIAAFVISYWRFELFKQ